VPAINRIAEKFQSVVLTQDWHPEDHVSFASNHPHKRPYDTIELSYGPQVPLCSGQLRRRLSQRAGDRSRQPRATQRYSSRHRLVFRFFENDHKTSTGLAGYLRERGLKTLFFAGLAFDFCVRFSAEDACKAGFRAFVIEEACRGIDLDSSVAATHHSFKSLGISTVGIEAFF
jgi:nicotinamidase/pyrazinamidase